MFPGRLPYDDGGPAGQVGGSPRCGGVGASAYFSRVMLHKLLPMENPEAYLRTLTAPLARARDGEPWPVARFAVEAVANAFVVLGLPPAARAAEILAAQRPVLEAAGLRVGLEIGELSISRGARLGAGEGRRPGQPAHDSAGGRGRPGALPAGRP